MHFRIEVKMAEAKAQPSMAVKAAKFFIPAIVALIIAFIPAPEGLTFQGMVFIGVFLCVVAWMILAAVPDFIALFIGLSVLIIAGCGSWAQVFAQFSGSTMWTVVAVFAIAAAVKKSGLLDRIALMILVRFPGSYKGQIAGLMTTGLVLSPMIPSTTAKAAILMPFAQKLANIFGWKKNDKPMAGMFGAIYMITQYLGMAFLTGGVVSYVIIGFLPEEMQGDWTWTYWISNTWPWLVVGLILTYLTTVLFFAPKASAAADAAKTKESPVKAEYEALQPLSHEEKVALGFLIVAFLGWTVGGIALDLDAGAWSLIVMGVMVAFGVLTADEFIAQIPWKTIFFIGGIFSLAGMISTTGVSTWLAGIIAPYLGPIINNPYLFVTALCIITYVVRLLIVSQSATVTIFIAGLMGTCVAAGINPWVLVFVVYLACFVFHFNFTSVQYIANMALTNGTMVDHKAMIPYNIAFMVIHLVACLVSVPWWQMMGLLPA